LDRRQREQLMVDALPNPNRFLVKEYGFFDYLKATMAVGENPEVLGVYLAEQRQAKQRLALGGQ
jgi:hypothetical protein